MLDLLIFVFGTIFSSVVFIVIIACMFLKGGKEEDEAQKLRKFMAEYQKHLKKN